MDIGTWLSLGKLYEPTRNGNIVKGKHCGIDTSNCILVGDGNHLLATLGTKDIIVIHTSDVTFVCHKDRVEDIPALLKRLDEKSHEKYL